MMNRRRPSLDANHVELVQKARACGWSVYDGASVGGGASDVIVAAPSKVTVLVEIKTVDPQAAFYLGQLEFLGLWAGHAAIATSFSDMRRAIENPEQYCLTNEQKRALITLAHKERLRLARMDNKTSAARHKVAAKRVFEVLETARTEKTNVEV